MKSKWCQQPRIWGPWSQRPASQPRGFALVRAYKEELETIRSMDARLEKHLYTGSDNGITRVWNEGMEISHFRSIILSGPVSAIILPTPEKDFLFAFLADITGPRAWKRNVPPMGNLRIAGIMMKWFGHLKDRVRRLPDGYEVRFVCTSEDGNLIYSGSADGKLITCTVRNHANNFVCKVVDITPGHAGAISALAVGPGVIFSGGSDGLVIMWKGEWYGRKKQKVRHTRVAQFSIQDGIEPSVVNSLAFGGDISSVTGSLYAGYSDGKPRCWQNLDLNDPTAHQPLPEVMIQDEGHSNMSNPAVVCLALCSGPYVFSGLADGQISVWMKVQVDEEHTAHMLVAGVRAHDRRITCLVAQNAWNADVGQPSWVLYSSSSDRFLKIWRVSDPKRDQEE